MVKRIFARLGLGIAGLIVFVLAVAAVQAPMHLLHVGNLAGYAIMLPLQLVLYAGIVALLERRRVSELRPARTPEAIAGFFIGLCLFSIALGVLAIRGDYRVTGHSASCRTPAGRGLRWSSRRRFFGVAHALNPGATFSSTIGIALQAGVMLGLAYSLTRRLWLPIGIHIGWNFA
jgi:membrane protease YdiL (CAAX protease family)